LAQPPDSCFQAQAGSGPDASSPAETKEESVQALAIHSLAMTMNIYCRGKLLEHTQPIFQIQQLESAINGLINGRLQLVT
jgi:hypothetical protein